MSTAGATSSDPKAFQTFAEFYPFYLSEHFELMSVWNTNCGLPCSNTSSQAPLESVQHLVVYSVFLKCSIHCGTATNWLPVFPPW